MRLFQDAAGTIPAYLPGHPVGLVKRMAGTVDASQPTALSRPTLARWPKGGRRNLVRATEDFANAAWNKIAAGSGILPIITPNYGLAPDGTLTATRVQLDRGEGNTSSDYSDFRQETGAVLPIGELATISVWAKSVSGDPQVVQISSNSGADTRNITVTGEWQRFSGSGYAVAGPHFFRIWTRGTFPTSKASDILIWHPQAELGPLSPYQKVVSQYDVTEAGVTDVWHLSNDGGDSLPVTLPAGTYGRARVNAAGVVTIDTVVDPTNALVSNQQVDIILRQGAFTSEEEAKIRAYWARYAA